MTIDRAIPSSSLSTQAPGPSRALVRLWVGVLLPPAVWAADLLSRYMLIRYANTHDLRWPVRVPTVICVGLLLAGAAMASQTLRAARQIRRAGDAAADAARDERITLALWGLALSAFFLLLMLAGAVPAFMLSPVEIT